MSAAPLHPGDEVQGLRVEQRLGRGAHAATYRVSSLDDGAVYALKEYLPGDLASRGDDGALQPVDDEAANAFRRGLRQFLDEARLAESVRHANLVSGLRHFEANGTAYLLMPHAPGCTLEELIARSGALDGEETLELALPIIDALDALHRAGVYHQDVKPANLWIADDGTPLLLDLGAAASDRRLGSPGYAAPEQGHPDGRIDARTDFYGLGATLYRSVCGAVPPPADVREAAVTAGQPDPLRSVSGSARHPQEPGVAAAIEWAMALEPAARPPDAATWRAAFTSPRAALGKGAGPPEPLPAEKPPWAAIIGTAVTVSALLVLAVWLLMGRGERPPDSEADATPAAEAPAPPPAADEALRRWQAALAADTLFAYRLFLEDFPDSIHAPQAQAQVERLDGLAWEAARAEDSFEAYGAYLADFPEGLHVADAKIAIDRLERLRAEAEREAERLARAEQEAWDGARRQRTLAAVDAFLQAWPGGANVEAARALKAQLEAEAGDDRAFDAARNLDTIAAYRTYLEAHPQGRHVGAALAAIDALTLRPGSRFRDCPDCPEMVVLPAGAFTQGAAEESPLALENERPARRVTLAEPFAIGVHEVTFAQWDACVAAGGCETVPGDNGWGRERHPVINVSWDDARAYVEWLSAKTGEAYRLPSESEWEYAARAGQQGDWPGGSPEALCAHANIAAAETGLDWAHADCADPQALGTLPVGALAPNGFGLHDTVGNVAEWTRDCLTLSYLDAPTDGSAWQRGMCSSRMTRGGSWFTGAREGRLPARFNLRTGDSNDFTGFRVVRPIPPQ